MEYINIEKLKRAVYIQERFTKGNKINQVDNAFNKWIEDIILPKEYIKNYLNSYKMQKDDFNSILHQNVDEIEYGKNYEWIEQVKSIMRAFDNNDDVLKYIKNNEYRKHPFIAFSYPFLKWIYSSIDLKKYETIEEEVIVSSLLEAALDIILKISSKTMVIELARFKSEKRLIGADSKERYQDFCRQIKTKEIFQEIIYRYPTMIRIIIEECIQQKKFILEAISNFNSDFQEIKNMFNLSGKLIDIQRNLGDSHCGKKCVLIFCFEKGKVVYKPRSLEIDMNFNSLIDYVNKKSLRYRLKKINLLVRDSYGWQEYIEYLGCSKKEEIDEIYYKIGVYSCLFHILLGSDMHMENLIICKSDPYFIDIESLFQGFNGNELKNETSYEKVLGKIRDSVLSTCLFPASMNRNNNKEVSGICGHGGQYIEKGKYHFDNNYTDKIKLVRKQFIIKDKKNIPLLNNKLIDPKEYTSFILNGFDDCYNLIFNNKIDFIGENGLIYKFGNNKVRTIVRNTNDYSIVLNASTHPQYLINAVYRNKLFDRMWSILNTNNKFIDIIPSEIKDLLNGDIPYFYSLVNSKSIYDSSNHEYKNFYDETVLEKVVKRIESMNKEDKLFQLGLIKLAMVKPIKKWELKENKKDYSGTCGLLKECDEYILGEAEKLALKILKMGERSKKHNDLCWLNVMIGNAEQWVFSPLDASLYDGVLGIGLFFGCLYKMTKKKEYMDIVEKILESSELYIELYKNIDSISAYCGDASIAYCYYFLGIILNRVDLKEKGISFILRCKDFINDDENFDIISGCAGTLIVALNIYKKSLNNDVLDIAIACGNHLIKKAVFIDDCVGWKTPVGGEFILTGMSHGNAGIAWALLELYDITDKGEFFYYGVKAISYERKNYSPENKNWFDLRNRENRIAKGFPEPVNWCHGAPGIGMARIKCFNILGDETVRDEIDAAIEKTLKEGFGGSDCLCHGSLGNMDLLLLASTNLNYKKYHNIAKEITYDLVIEAEKNQWYCGIPQKSQVPTLMLGLAGIGYGLLRVLDPINVPSVLTLELPEESHE